MGHELLKLLTACMDAALSTNRMSNDEIANRAQAWFALSGVLEKHTATDVAQAVKFGLIEGNGSEARLTLKGVNSIVINCF